MTAPEPPLACSPPLMRRIALLAIALLALLPAAAAAQNPGLVAKRLTAEMRFAGAYAGAYVVNVSQGKPRAVFRWREHTPRILASNAKLFTTTAALARFGAEDAGHRGPGGRRTRRRGGLSGASTSAAARSRPSGAAGSGPGRTAVGRPLRIWPTCSPTRASRASPAACTATSRPSTRCAGAPTRATASRSGSVRSARCRSTAGRHGGRARLPGEPAGVRGHALDAALEARDVAVRLKPRAGVTPATQSPSQASTRRPWSA